MCKIFSDNILIDDGFNVFNLSRNDEVLKNVNLKYLCKMGIIRYDRTQWGADHFIVLKDYEIKKLSKSELNQNIHLSEGNIKSKGTEDVMFLTWSLPSKIACPYSTEMCRKRCFAKKNETFAGVRNSRHKNLEETKKDTFVQDMITHLEYHLARPKAKDKRVFVRIHTSGDYYNLDYLIKWVYISEYFKDNDKILFQSYTKSMPIITEYIEEHIHLYGDEFSPKEIIEDINIHFVWSIWDDTPKEYTDIALDLEMQTFTAMTKEDLNKSDKDVFRCGGDCGNCKQCYTGSFLKIAIPYH